MVRWWCKDTVVNNEERILVVDMEYIGYSSEALEKNSFTPAMICPRGQSPHYTGSTLKSVELRVVWQD